MTPTEGITTVSAEPDNAIEADRAIESDQTEETVQIEEHMMEDAAPAEGQPDNAAKSSRDFTPEERATIITMAKEVGFAEVANEFGIKARLISYWIQQEKKKAARPTKPSKRPAAKASTKGKDSKRTLVKGRTLVKEVAQPEHITDTPAVAAMPVKADKPSRADKPAGRKAERTVPAKPVGSAKPREKSEEKRELNDRQSLIIENAILKERISALNAEIEKLRAALMSLM